jgi:hypothetical protein
MHKFINPNGAYQDLGGDKAKSPNFANWCKNGNDTKDIIQQNFEDEQKRLDEQAQRWSGGGKST